MILVTLGTQDKSFKRLLKQIDKEIKDGNIKEEVIVQAGHTKYTSTNMKIFDFLPPEEFSKLFDKARLLITHSGVGTILGALKKEKTVIVVPRLKEYKEHTNNHQLEILKQFDKYGYIIPVYDLKKLSESLRISKSFKPSKYESNTKSFTKLIEDKIENLVK